MAGAMVVVGHPVLLLGHERNNLIAVAFKARVSADSAVRTRHTTHTHVSQRLGLC